MPFQSVEELLDCFARTLDDGDFSAAESKVLAQLVSEARMTKSEIEALRRGIFELVIDRVRQPEFRHLLRWLEGAAQTLLMTDRSEADTRVFFTPGKSCENAICSALQKARERLDICVFTITNDNIAEGVKQCHERGVRVRIITDNDKANDPGSDIERLAACGIAVKQDATPDHMHHKFAIFDTAIAFTGSYNWTHSTRRNHENLVTTTDASTVTAFSREFERLWKRMNRLRPVR
ncbi:MAG: phospholipase D-like domain-containing protein [Verrucomicrobia bacterium]|nr:phospholipase D-like domain-containing protein [Verrucomicrobiota bacterium]